MTDFDVETIRYCAEVNGPCWECSMRDQCQRWKEMDEMSGYISRDAALAALDELERTSRHNSVLWPDHVEECREALRSIPAVDVRFLKPWVPVKERLPESGVPTLICGDGNVVEQGFFDDEFGYWYDWRGIRTFVHHWMPLPQPPEGGDMICTECENCIEDYNGKPYCFIGQFSLDGISMQRGSPCEDFEPKEK